MARRPEDTERAEDAVADLAERVGRGFRRVRRLLSFAQYVDLLREDPARHCRCAARYLVDMLDYFGRTPVERFGETADRFRLFDGDFPGGRDFLCGQEQVQEEVYHALKAMAEEGRTDRLVVLHGPNGSAKTTLVNLIFRGLEHYSRTDEGALYRFNWIFPKPQRTDARLGFRGEPPGEEETYAFLPPEDVAARIPCELKDPPVFLIPVAEREAFFRELTGLKDVTEVVSPYFLEGDLSPKCKAIYDALLTSYHGDWRRVLRHVQVERFFLERRFRCGLVTIDPQMHVDVVARQLTHDASLEYLPAVLQNLRLVEPYGDLADANRGTVEYSDFLKRPVDMNKYLLNTVETGAVNLPGLRIHLDAVFLGTTNASHLDAFKKTLEFTSFKARMELVQVPYLLRYSDEEGIYRDVVRRIGRRKHVAPHTVRVAALWAVLTRLQRPDRRHYPRGVGALVERLSPLEKAKLYDHGEVPAWMREDERQELRRALPLIRREYAEEVFYEGRFGASPREVKTILFAASHRPGRACASPLGVFEVLEDFVRERHVYEFLRLEPNGKYNDNAGFIATVRDEYHAWIAAELEEAMELVEEAEYERRCDEYFRHVVAYIRGEKVPNPSTGELEEPSRQILEGVEGLLQIREGKDLFRQKLVARIGAFRLDHPEAPLVYRELFPDIYEALKQDFFSRRRQEVERIEGILIEYGTEPPASLLPREREQVLRTVRNLKGRYGYCDRCLQEMVRFARRHRRLDDGGD